MALPGRRGGWTASTRWSVSGPSRRGGYDTKLSMKPTEYFQRQCYVTYIRDELGVKYRNDIGVDRIMWSSDFPHLDSSWPESRRFLDDQLVGVPDDERRLIVAENCIRLYGLRDRLAPPLASAR